MFSIWRRSEGHVSTQDQTYSVLFTEPQGVEAKLVFTFLVLPGKQVEIQSSNASKATVTEGQANLAGDKIRSSTPSSTEVPSQNIQLPLQAVGSISVDGREVCQLAGCYKLTPWLQEGISSLAGPENCYFPEDHSRNIAKMRALDFWQVFSHCTQS